MKAVRLLLALALVLSFVACTPAKPVSPLTGSWQSEDGKETIFFLTNVKVSMVSGSATITSTYKLSGPGKLEISLGMMGTSTLQYAVSKDSLTLTDAAGKAYKYNRMKDAAPAQAPAPAAEKKK